MEWLIDTFRENERFPAKTRRREVGVRSKTGYNSSTTPEHLRTTSGQNGCDTIVIVIVYPWGIFIFFRSPFVRRGNREKSIQYSFKNVA